MTVRINCFYELQRHNAQHCNIFNLMNVIYYNWNKSILIFLLYKEVFSENTFLGLRLVIKKKGRKQFCC